MESTDGRLRRWEEAELEISRIGSEAEWKNTYFCIGGYRIIASPHLQHTEMYTGNKITVVLCSGACCRSASKGFWKIKLLWHFKGLLTEMHKDNRQDSLKIKIDLLSRQLQARTWLPTMIYLGIFMFRPSCVAIFHHWVCKACHGTPVSFSGLVGSPFFLPSFFPRSQDPGLALSSMSTLPLGWTESYKWGVMIDQTGITRRLLWC